MAMFALAVLVYPAVLAVLTLGSGLLLHRAACPLPASLLPVTGIATLIALSQIGTYLPGSAPATPYAMCVLCAAGLWFGRRELSSLARRWRQGRGLIIVMVLAYLAAIAPVLLAGRASFSSYMALADSAVHMLGADFLTRYGQHYGRLDLHNSYGLFINNYYNTNYPSGSDTLLGGSASLLGLPVIWAFQPFCAFVLASAAGPLLTLARRLGLQGGSAALAALCATLPALVYGFELIGSIKELTALAMILAIGVLVVEHRRWLWRGPTGAVPFAVLGAGGISALGVGFGAWILASLALLGVLVIRGVRAAEGNPGGVFALVAVGAITALVCSWPTWVGLSGSLRVATGIASTSNPGNLHKPLRAIQALGVWLGGSYKLPPHGVLAVLTYTLIAVACLAAALGVLRALRSGEYTLLGWLGATLIVWLAVSLYSTTWVNAKALMITSPVLVLLGWGGVAALRHGGRRAGATVLALALGCGVLASDALQYHDSVLAPTARYEELARIDTRFAGRGPTLFTDFDEYSLYVLRDLDVGGPDFVYPPPALQRLAGGHGRPVDLDRASPRALRGYPLIVTRRDPLASRPPVAYRLLWQGAYYQVWGRTSALPAAVAHLALAGSLASQCASIGRLAKAASSPTARLFAARAPEAIRIDLARAKHTRGFIRERHRLLMGRPGVLWARFTVPRAGLWQVWVQGEVMRALHVAVDGHPLGSLAGQLDGNSLVANTMTPLTLRLSRGAHRVSLTRGGFSLAAGDGTTSVLDGIFLTPAGARGHTSLALSTAARWRSLCGAQADWVELLSA